ncbi:hypothetical protein [Desulfosarcina variabilis]|uniref:hypothetical protein n=1 Tax=Desulfosarcina variabilis TaxID=2300 RepID=UPI003AFAE8DB
MPIQERLKHEIKAMTIAAIYFGSWIGALLLLKSLILAEYRIAFTGWSMMVVGALILSKVVLVLEHVSLGAWVRSQPAWVDVILRTLMYTLGVAVVLVLEKGFEARHEFGGFGPAVRHLFGQTDVHHVWANVLCLSGALLGYNMLTVIQHQLGQGALIKIYFSRPLEKTETE